MTELYGTIKDALTTSDDAAIATGISVKARLSTLNGTPHLLPPTYADAPQKHNMTPPDGNGVCAWVSIDSPASFANRIEERLVRADLGLDPLRVRVADEQLSTMQMPHRSFDAILRDSSMIGTPFRKTEIGKAIIHASPANAGDLLRYDPAMLLLGGWDSTGLSDNRGKERKWPAALSVEIYGLDARPVNRAGGRLDPLGITLDAGPIIRDAGSYRVPTEGESLPEGVATLRPSEINHGNIAPTLAPKGVLVEQIQLAGALSLSRLRRYRFGKDATYDLAARTALALMGIYGIAAVIEDGLDLRRDCELVADEVRWTIRGTGFQTPLTITASAALAALTEALGQIELAEPICFDAGPNLEQLVARSR